MKYDFFSLCRFVADQPFCFVVCEHLQNVDEGASCLTLFYFRPGSLVGGTSVGSNTFFYALCMLVGLPIFHPVHFITRLKISKG